MNTLNIEKKEKYAELMIKLNKATNEEYYYEAIFIEYAIIEDRLEALLRYAGLKYKQDNGTNIDIQKKINKIQNDAKFQDSYIKKHITPKILNEIQLWKNERNRLIHNLVNAKYDNEEIKNIALQGECLAKKISNKSTLIKRYFQKLSEK